ncbi:uncharacterized protein Gasu_47230 [Galdieria sulphuraria]|uniref:Uncharacterized protein n=1 Tax=Galdieria sulphuraria TaxID=130081 RepID=M2VWW0_GALSU|nr:uncharacterized protein Gasu_47230 [Galdieria sulphuraria]EME27736.1 hypothetical protein Gasu_47230 [Galdieria sulphuraria]|eukprot:XP_005704256.1 hypothetical protein Gasu_47230 [Galdieria sulphuraria]
MPTSLLGRNPFLKRARKENEERVSLEVSSSPKPVQSSDQATCEKKFQQPTEHNHLVLTEQEIDNILNDTDPPPVNTTNDNKYAIKTVARLETVNQQRSSLFSFQQHTENDLRKVWRVKRKASKTKVETKENSSIQQKVGFSVDNLGSNHIPLKAELVEEPQKETTSINDEGNSETPQNGVAEQSTLSEKPCLKAKRFSPRKLSLIRNYIDTLKKLQDNQTTHVAEWGRKRMKQLIEELRTNSQDDVQSTENASQTSFSNIEKDIVEVESIGDLTHISNCSTPKEENSSNIDNTIFSSYSSLLDKEGNNSSNICNKETDTLETSFADLDANTIEKIAYFLQQQEHSLRYLRTQHVTQRRLLKAFLEDASEEKLESDFFVQHIHQFISLSYLPNNNTVDSQVQMESSIQLGGSSISWSGSYDFALHAMKEYILEYPAVFEVSFPQGRKQQVAQRALFSYLAFNPLANGIGARQKVVEYYRKYQSMRQQTENGNGSIRIERLLEQAMEQRSSSHKKQPIFIPYAKDRIPFDKEPVAKEWCIKVLMDKRKPEHEIPSVSYLSELVENAKQHSPHMYSWYEDFHCLIHECCVKDMSETQLFLSCLATCSPNSSLAQNTVNAMLNFRALSQGKRPRWGPYPMRSLINYLAGALGRPSGHKVRAFLENLLFPLQSKSVTIDTHMQKIALGTGRQSLSPLEYAVLEDYFRFVSDKMSEALPHRLQSSLWSVVAGNMDYCSELENYRKRVILNLPKEMDSSARDILLLHLRRMLLELGYLSRKDCDTAKDNATITFWIYVPLRKETVKSLKGHIALRRTFAKKQQRQLLAQEEQEIAEYERAIEYCMSKGEEEVKIDNPSDLKWFYRDWCQIQSYCEPGKLHWNETSWLDGITDENIISLKDDWLDHEDPYFGSHQYFDSCRDLQIILQRNGLWK